MEINNKTIYFAKLKDDVRIPSKDLENGGYDIYANFEDDFMIIKPHTTKMIPTGLISAFSHEYVAVLKERGSTGTKGIAQRCGVVDSGYRGEWFVPLTNTNTKPIIIIKEGVVVDTEGYIVYPYEKAICQALLNYVPQLEVKELSVDKLKAIPSKRGSGCLGSSNK